MILHKSEMDRLRAALGNMRHLYAQMVNGQVVDCKKAAKGLLGPAIRLIEEFADYVVA